MKFSKNSRSDFIIHSNKDRRLFISSVAIFFKGGVRRVTVKLFYETLPGAIASIPVASS